MWDTEAPGGREPFDSAAVAEQLARVLGSATFRAAESQRAFLRYTVQEAQAGRASAIKEYAIGVEGLGRPESFDPRLDPIVRTQARKLRANLSKYYEREGINDPIRIEFPKGAYVPVFVDVAAERAPQAQAPLESVEPVLPRIGPSVSIKTRRTPLLLSAAVALAVLMAWSGRYLGGASSPRTIAVIPFTNVTGNSEDDFISDGLTQELLNSLSRVPNLRVAGRTSTFRYKDKAMDLQDIARDLHAQAVLVGSVRHSPNRTTISAQLVDAATQQRLWTGYYDRSLDDMQGVDREISEAVSGTMAASLAGFGFSLWRKKAGAAGPHPAAYQSYLRGLFFWNKMNAESLRMAIGYFEDAITQDPSFARAYTALADSYAMAPMVSALPSPQAVPKIRAAATKAIELDSSLGEAHIDLAICAEYDFEWDTAEREFKKGLELSPSNAVAHLWYARLLALRGRTKEVLAERKIAAELDPVSPYAVQAVGGYYSVMGMYDDAIRYFRSALELEPRFGYARQGLGIAYLLQHRPADAFRELKLATEFMEGPRRLALLGYAYGKAGRTAEARQVLRELKELGSKQAVPALAFAHVYLGLGDYDDAFEWMDRAVDEKDLGLTLQWDSHYEPIRQDPRYQALLRRMKLS